MSKVVIRRSEFFSVRFIPHDVTDQAWFRLLTEANKMGLEGKRLSRVVAYQDFCGDESVFLLEPDGGAA